MTQIDKWDCYTYVRAAETLGVPVWRLRYAVDSGYLPGPVVVLKRRAMFAPSQIERMREYFAREIAASRVATGKVSAPLVSRNEVGRVYQGRARLSEATE